MSSMGMRLAALGLAAVAATVLPRATFAAEDEVVVDTDALSQDVRVYVAKTGGEVTKLVQDAQKLTASTTDLAGASRDVGKALALVNAVEQTSPTDRLRRAIATVLHHHRVKKAKADDVLPVMGVLDEVSQVQGIDVADVKTSLERARGHLQEGATVEAEADLTEAYEGVGYLEFDLPVKETELRLHAARVALLRRDRANANAQLNQALDHVKAWTAMAEGAVVEEDAAD